MASTPYIALSDIQLLASVGGYNPSPALSQSSAVFLLSSCQVMRLRWIWQSAINPIDDSEYQSIIELIELAESDLMTSFAIGQIIPSVVDLSSNTSLLALDGQSVLQTDYPELSSVVPASWLVGLNIDLPDMSEKSLHGENGSNLGDIVGENNVTLDVSEIPSHNHTQNPHQHSEFTVSSIPTAAGLEPALASLVTIVPTVTGLTTATNNYTGGDGSHNNVPESLSINYWIVAI